MMRRLEIGSPFRLLSQHLWTAWRLQLSTAREHQVTDQSGRV